jgi:hypothetical protein
LQYHRTTQQKEPRQPTAFVQRWGRSNGKGNPRVGYVADRQDRRPNPDRGSPGRTNGNAVSIRESELDHRRPCAPSLPLHDPTTNQSALPAQRGIDKLRAECLTGDIRDLQAAQRSSSERSLVQPHVFQLGAEIVARRHLPAHHHLMARHEAMPPSCCGRSRAASPAPPRVSPAVSPA